MRLIGLLADSAHGERQTRDTQLCAILVRSVLTVMESDIYLIWVRLFLVTVSKLTHFQLSICDLRGKVQSAVKCRQIMVFLGPF